jgi:membrane protein DedA with SNARE-associated domain
MFLLARFLIGLRSPVYLTAGILRIPFRRFLLIDLVCATSVIGTFFGLSYLYGETILHWVRRAEILLTVVVALAVAGGAIYLWRRHRPSRSASQPRLSELGRDAAGRAPSTGEAEAPAGVEHLV